MPKPIPNFRKEIEPLPGRDRPQGPQLIERGWPRLWRGAAGQAVSIPVRWDRALRDEALWIHFDLLPLKFSRDRFRAQCIHCRGFHPKHERIAIDKRTVEL